MVPYDNLLAVAKKHMRFLPVSLLMRDKWDNVKALAGYHGPVEIFGAQHDTVIPVAHARALAKSVPQARYVELPCGHNEWALNELVKIKHE
jgi:pimeloyl-ACP methyl ester carboxylesterase